MIDLTTTEQVIAIIMGFGSVLALAVGLIYEVRQED